jgi:hypothetical protein
MVDAVEPDQAYHDEVEGDDIVQQPWKDQDQNTGDKSDERRDVSDGEDHFKSPRMVRMIGLATIDTPHSCTDAKCCTTALGGLILVLQAGIVRQLNDKRDVCLWHKAD